MVKPVDAPQSMLEDAFIEQLNRGYVCPPDAGPAWRAACDYGFDMSLVEEALKKTPEERLEAHQRALDMILSLKSEYKTTHDDASWQLGQKEPTSK